MSTLASEAIAQAWFRAFNAHDLEALLALYDDRAEHFSPKLKVHRPETKGYIQGKEALRTWWRDAFERLPQLRYEPIRILGGADMAFLEYLRKVPGEEDLRVGEVLEIREGRIFASRVYHS